jgi:dolichol-phosphate mannosyltransferase
MPNLELAIVMPVFNEQASVCEVVKGWVEEVAKWTSHFVFIAVDDGSTDGTPAVLSDLKDEFGARLEIIRHTNRGHGQSCLVGYRAACERGIPWVFQIDSDGQCDPQYFAKLWKERETGDVVYGHRVSRDDGWRRVMASHILCVTILLVKRTWCVDANVPYRLMRTEKLSPILQRIPRSFVLANVALAVLLRQAGWRHGVVPIGFRKRLGGEPSVPLRRFGAKAWELILQLRDLPKP